MPTYNKLVRDKIPEIIKRNGSQPVFRKLDDEEYYRELRNKLNEEVGEFLSDNNAEELADIMEVVLALAAHLGHSAANLEKIRADKAKKRGGFDKRYYLIAAE